VCHKDVKLIHESAAVITADATVSGVTITPVGADLQITFNVKVKGVDSDAFASLSSAYVYTEDPALAGNPLTPTARSNNMRVFIARAVDGTTVTTPATIVSNGSGNYTITVPADSGDTVGTPVQYVYTDAAYLFRLDDGATYANSVRPIVVAKYGTPPLRDLVDQNGCVSCHGDYVFRDSHYSAKSEDCQICHVRAGRSFYIADQQPDLSWDTTTNAGDGGNLPIYVHGVHNSHNMPAGIAYFHNEPWSVGYPSAMKNCSTCHTTTAQLEAAVTAPVSFYLCMSCHQSWDGFVHGHDASDGSYAAGDKIMVSVLGFLHANFGIATDCMTACHGTYPQANEAADFHNDMQGTDAHYDSFYRGVDISFANEDNVSFAITGVAVSGSDVTFTWTAEMNSTPVNPCNTNVAAGPVFSGIGGYLAYAKGDDWVNELVSTTPGQPVSARNLFTSLSTTCASNVATTTGLTLNTDATTYATKALLALGGKPLATSAAAGGTYFVRVPSPTYAFNTADGSAATARRAIVDSTKCTGCHQGTMYQHGGDRIDNVQMCVICHNPASSDKNNRLTRYQIVNADGTVDTDSTYDGRTSESYDIRNLLHAIHSVGNAVNQADPFVIYRSRGVYAFVNDQTAKPTGWPADGMTIYGSDNGSTIAHNWVVIHYPKPVNDCEACHDPGTYEAPDQTKAVAMTDDAGTNWAYQSDDIVIGPTAAACTSCHDSAPVLSHAQSFGYREVVPKDIMLDKAK
jgi:OmcA/MtrC family decaheme c-type cytochrome